MSNRLEICYEDSTDVGFFVEVPDVAPIGMEFLFGIEKGFGEFEEMYLTTAEAEALYYFLEKNLNLKLDND